MPEWTWNKEVSKDSEIVIFDLDGTLVNSMSAHFEAWCKALAANGAPKDVFPEDVFYSMGGRPTKDIIKEINGIKKRNKNLFMRSKKR